MKEIIKKPWDYTFINKNGKYYLSVMCGSVGVYEIIIELNDMETSLYKERGEKYIDSLAKEIQFASDKYSSRNLPNIP